MYYCLKKKESQIHFLALRSVFAILKYKHIQLLKLLVLQGLADVNIAKIVRQYIVDNLFTSFEILLNIQIVSNRKYH